MIVRFLGFLARAIFDLGLAALVVACGLLYLSGRILYRLVRDVETPRRDATFALLAAVVTLARALNVQLPKETP